MQHTHTHKGLRLTEEQMRPWFEHIEHVVPHLVVPVGEDQTSTRTRPTRSSFVQYRFHINALQFSPIFTTLLEDALLFNLRAEDVEYVSTLMALS
mgnify:CR=1 FL=1